MVALPFCHFELLASRPKPSQYPKQINSLGDQIRARRLDLKLLQKQVAEQIGVHELTITGWERNATVPEVRYMPAIIQLHSGLNFPANKFDIILIIQHISSVLSIEVNT